MWKKGVCDECGAETLVRRSRGRWLCKECYKEFKKKRKLEKLRLEEK